MGWIQSKIPDVPITNFTSDWNDGRAVGALVDAVAPGILPRWNDTLWLEVTILVFPIIQVYVRIGTIGIQRMLCRMPQRP